MNTAAVDSSPRDADKSSSIRDVALAAGVSIATVSRVINNSPEVAPATAAKVREVTASSATSPTRSPRPSAPRAATSSGSLCRAFMASS